MLKVNAARQFARKFVLTIEGVSQFTLVNVMSNCYEIFRNAGGPYGVHVLKNIPGGIGIYNRKFSILAAKNLLRGTLPSGILKFKISVFFTEVL